MMIGVGMMDEHYSGLPPRGKKHSAKNNKKETFLSELISTVKYIIGILIVFFIINQFFFAPVMVDGDSMEPTLTNGDYLLLNKFSAIEQFDIVVFPPPDQEETQYVKRVIGLPGDTIEYHEDVLYLNGEPTEQSFLDESKEVDASIYTSGDFTLLTLLGVETVPDGQYFVLGDNRLNSRDSRSFGFIDQESVLGKVSFRYWPIEEIGVVE